jgi:cobalt-zinc-cadmium efflux system outer membrane protein
MVEAVGAAYRANRADLEDATRVEIMAVQLDQARFAAEQRLTSAQAMINALAGRDPDAPLGAPATPVPSDAAVDAAALAGLQDRSRGELRAADAAIAREAAAGDLARADARPRFMVGARYMYMPAGHDFEHGYGVMLSMTLPWLDASRGGKAAAARHREVAERASEDATRAAVRYELADAASRLRAARARLTSVREQLLPRAERLYESARVELAGGRGDAGAVLLALDSWLALRLDLERGVAEVAIAEADLERAVGAPLPRDGGAP